MLAHEGEESRPLVLPDRGFVVTVHHDPVAGSLATQGGQEGVRPGVADLVHAVALLVAHEALRVPETPGRTGRLGARVGLALHCDVVPDAGQLAGRSLAVPGAADRPGMEGLGPVGLADQHTRVAHRDVTPLQDAVIVESVLPPALDLIGEGVVISPALEIDHQPLEALSPVHCGEQSLPEQGGAAHGVVGHKDIVRGRPRTPSLSERAGIGPISPAT